MAPTTPSTDRLYRPEVVDPMDQAKVGPHAIRNELGRAIQELMSGVENVNLPVSVIQHLTWERIAALEAEGIVFSGVSKEHPDGGVYIKGSTRSELGLSPEDPVFPKGLKSVTATSFLRGVTGLTTKPPIDKLPKDLSGLKRFPMNSLVAAVYKDGKWSESHVLPDGKWLRGGYDDSTSQYGQSCFEGMVATDTQEEDPVELNVVNGKVTVFRPEENAKRFQKSCESVGLPPISVDQFVAAVLAAIKNNKEFIPKNGKLYCRPFMVGLEGGTGIIPATSCLFAVEVSPYGTYLSAKSDGVDLEKELPGSSIKSIKYQRPKSGKHKISGNYGAMIKEKQDAKHEGFNDVLLIDDHGRIQECASNNVFLVEHDSDTHFTLHTSSLDANILPGITRASIIELLRDRKLVQERFGKELNITVRDDKILHESELTHMDGSFGSGTAAGIGTFHEIQMRNGKSVKFHKGTATQHFIKKLYDLLQDLRRGKVPGYEKWVTTVD